MSVILSRLRTSVVSLENGTMSTSMIVRVSEAHVLPARAHAFLRALHELVASFPSRYDGLVAHEVLIDDADSDRIQYVSRWSDEAALIAYAGEDWKTTPVTFPNESDYLSAPLTLRHFVVSADDQSRHGH